MNTIRNHSEQSYQSQPCKVVNDYTLFPTPGNLVCRHYIKNVFIG
jgi:hypothetical protein